jgi:hypothetical protein
MDSRFARRSQIRLLFSHITWMAEKHLELVKIPSWMFPFHETDVFIPVVIHELISRISATPTFRGYKVFSNSPTLAPRGSGFTPTIRFHENSWILIKNVALGMSEWTRVLQISRNGHIETVFLKLPLAPINRELAP